MKRFLRTSLVSVAATLALALVAAPLLAVATPPPRPPLREDRSPATYAVSASSG